MFQSRRGFLGTLATLPLTAIYGASRPVEATKNLGTLLVKAQPLKYVAGYSYATLGHTATSIIRSCSFSSVEGKAITKKLEQDPLATLSLIAGQDGLKYEGQNNGDNSREHST